MDLSHYPRGVHHMFEHSSGYDCIEGPVVERGALVGVGEHVHIGPAVNVCSDYLHRGSSTQGCADARALLATADQQNKTSLPSNEPLPKVCHYRREAQVDRRLRSKPSAPSAREDVTLLVSIRLPGNSSLSGAISTGAPR